MVGALEPDGRFLCRCRRCGVILKFFLVWLKVAVGQPLEKEVQSAVRSVWKGANNEIWRAVDVTIVFYGFYLYPTSPGNFASVYLRGTGVNRIGACLSSAKDGFNYAYPQLSHHTVIKSKK